MFILSPTSPPTLYECQNRYCTWKNVEFLPVHIGADFSELLLQLLLFSFLPSLPLHPFPFPLPPLFLFIYSIYHSSPFISRLFSWPRLRDLKERLSSPAGLGGARAPNDIWCIRGWKMLLVRAVLVQFTKLLHRRINPSVLMEKIAKWRYFYGCLATHNCPRECSRPETPAESTPMLVRIWLNFWRSVKAKLWRNCTFVRQIATLLSRTPRWTVDRSSSATTASASCADTLALRSCRNRARVTSCTDRWPVSTLCRWSPRHSPGPRRNRSRCSTTRKTVSIAVAVAAFHIY